MNAAFLGAGVLFAFVSGSAFAGPFAPAAGLAGSTAIPRDSPDIIAWASAVGEVQLGYQDLSDPDLGFVSYGVPEDALGVADAHVDSLPVFSLGDAGFITLRFASPIQDTPGPDLAVFENAFIDSFLELAFVEVSSNGIDFFRFPSISHTQPHTQIGAFGALDPTNIHNLAGKYRRGFGTPFDLFELAGISPLLNVQAVTHVRVVDVVGSIDPLYARFDSLGNIINDPWPMLVESSGFDLDAIAVLYHIPEPGSASLLFGATVILGFRRLRGPLSRMSV